MQNKLAWLRTHFVPHFGERVVTEAIIDKAKSRHDALALIDDRPGVEMNAGAATWRLALFDRPYNQHFSAALRIRGLDDPDLEKILQSAC